MGAEIGEAHFPGGVDDAVCEFIVRDVVAMFESAILDSPGAGFSYLDVPSCSMVGVY